LANLDAEATGLGPFHELGGEVGDAGFPFHAGEGPDHYVGVAYPHSPSVLRVREELAYPPMLRSRNQGADADVLRSSPAVRDDAGAT
jgi:hypothetical protein